MEPLLEGKNAVVCGAAARAYAREWTRVYLASRTLAKLDGSAEEIYAAAGSRTRAPYGLSSTGSPR